MWNWLWIPAQDSHQAFWRGKEDQLSWKLCQWSHQSTKGWIHWGQSTHSCMQLGWDNAPFYPLLPSSLCFSQLYCVKAKQNFIGMLCVYMADLRLGVKMTHLIHACSDTSTPFFFYLLQVQLSAVTPPPKAPIIPTSLEDSLSGLSITAAPPTMPTELQTGSLAVCQHLFPDLELNPTMLKCVCLPQVCPQYLCSPPPPAPPLAPSPPWILLPPASTPPPRYQVSGFVIKHQLLTWRQTFILHRLCVWLQGWCLLRGAYHPSPTCPISTCHYRTSVLCRYQEDQPVNAFIF